MIEFHRELSTSDAETLGSCKESKDFVTVQRGRHHHKMQRPFSVHLSSTQQRYFRQSMPLVHLDLFEQSQHCVRLERSLMGLVYQNHLGRSDTKPIRCLYGVPCIWREVDRSSILG